jgi:WD40 repeat protein
MARAFWYILAAWTCAALMGCEDDRRSFPPLSLTKYDQPVMSLAIDPTGTTLATAGKEDRGAGAPSLLFWDLKSGQSKSGYENGKDADDVYYSKDGKRLLCVSFWIGTLAVWDAETGKRIFQLDGKGTQWLLNAALAPDGKTAATYGHGDSIRLWDVDTGKERCALEGHTATVRSLAFSPDGKLLASASGDQTVRVWDVAAQKLLATFPDHEKPVKAVAFSPDGGLLASGGEDGNVILWDVSTLKQRSMIVANYEGVIEIAFQPDGKQLAVVGGRAEAVADKGEEGAITFFDTATGKALQVLTRIGQNPIDQRPFCCVSFSPDGKLLAAGSLSTTQPITVWEQDDHGIWKKKW